MNHHIITTTTMKQKHHNHHDNHHINHIITFILSHYLSWIINQPWTSAWWLIPLTISSLVDLKKWIRGSKTLLLPNKNKVSNPHYSRFHPTKNIDFTRFFPTIKPWFHNLLSQLMRWANPAFPNGLPDDGVQDVALLAGLRDLVGLHSAGRKLLVVLRGMNLGYTKNNSQR